MERRKENTDKRKELLKTVSPMLRIFIDKYAKSDPEMWTAMVDKTFMSKKDEMLDILGEKTIQHDIGSFLWMGSTRGVFNSESDDETRTGFTFCIACMGYEIGEESDVDLFFE